MPLQKITKEEIIQNSIDVFRQKGYYRTSMADLAKQSGVTKGAFYHHFKNKEEVMLKSLEVSSEWFKKKVFYIAYDETLTGKVRLKKLLDGAFQAFYTGAGGCFFSNTILETAHVEDTFKLAIVAFFENWEKALTHILTDKYTTEKAKILGQQIIVDIEGSIILMQLHNNVAYLKKAMERAMEMI